MENRIRYDTIGWEVVLIFPISISTSVLFILKGYIDNLSNLSLSLSLFFVVWALNPISNQPTLVKRQIRDTWCCGMTRRDARWLIYIVTLLQHACVTTSARSHSDNNISLSSVSPYDSGWTVPSCQKNESEMHVSS